MRDQELLAEDKLGRTRPSRIAGDASAGSGISTGSSTSYVVTGLQSKTLYYFALTAVDAAGNESIFSNEVSKLTP